MNSTCHLCQLLTLSYHDGYYCISCNLSVYYSNTQVTVATLLLEKIHVRADNRMPGCGYFINFKKIFTSSSAHIDFTLMKQLAIKYKKLLAFT